MYSVQVVSGKTSEVYCPYFHLFKDAGYPVQIVERFVNGEIWYGVRVGKFDTEYEAGQKGLYFNQFLPKDHPSFVREWVTNEQTYVCNSPKTETTNQNTNTNYSSNYNTGSSSTSKGKNDDFAPFIIVGIIAAIIVGIKFKKELMGLGGLLLMRIAVSSVSSLIGYGLGYAISGNPGTSFAGAMIGLTVGFMATGAME